MVKLMLILFACRVARYSNGAHLSKGNYQTIISFLVLSGQFNAIYTVVTLELTAHNNYNNIIKDDAHEIYVGGNLHIVCQPK